MTIVNKSSGPAVLADLEARAGASDKDREAWLAERLAGITATEVRDLYLGKITVQDLVDLKLGRKVDSFSGNGYTAWGSEREPFIAAMLADEGFVPESRVFHHPENSRHLASPDGIALSFDDEIQVLEIKTAATDLPPGSEALRKKGYVEQIQWNLRVTGGVLGRLVVEERVTGPDGFEPGPMHRHFIARDDALIAELVTLADGFLAELDRQREEGAPAVDEAVDTHAVNYLRGLAEEKAGAELKKAAYAALLAAGKSQTSAIARVTYTPAKPGAVVPVEETDFDAARAAAPELFEALQAAQHAWDAHVSGFTTTRQVEGKASPARVTVTEVKEKTK